jgi:nicotinamidase-related amidase
MPRKIDLMIIDPQNSFCKVVEAAEQQILHDGELCVPGAWDSMCRVGKMIDRVGRKVDNIRVTLDSHHPIHIAHPTWFKDSDGNPPPFFTIMRNEKGTIIGSHAPDYTNAVEYLCTIPAVTQWTLDYLKALEDGNRYPHCIWPNHCEIGTPGHNIVSPLYDALRNWALDTQSTVDFVTKGSNFKVEHFSAVRSEVFDPDDLTTQLNTDFIGQFMEADEIILTGEEWTYCVANTIRDIANEFVGSGSLGDNDEFIRKCVLLTDGTDYLPHREDAAKEFTDEMVARGMKVSTTVDYLN